MSAGIASADTAGRDAPRSLTADLLKNACAADPHFRERYDLETWQELGRGAFACVARVYCRDRAEEVAVKVFYCLTEESRARMRAEVLNAQRAYSELLVRVHTPFSSGDLAWIEMELVRGRNLDQEIASRKLEGRPFGVQEGLALGSAIAEALEAAHRAGVIHRDLKPANLLLPQDRCPPVKLGDFGISKFREAARLTATGEIPGTPQYAAPEVWEAKGASAAADVYSLGIVLFRILTNGAYAYDLPDGATTPQVFVAHRQQVPRRIRKMSPAVPESIEGLILRTLAKDPKARPPLCEVIPVLRAAVDTLTNSPASTPKPSPRMIAVFASGATGLLLAGAIWMAARPLREAQPGIDAHPPLPGTPARAESALSSPQPVVAVAPPVEPPTAPLRRAFPALTPSPRLSTPPAPSIQVAIEGPAVAVTNASAYAVRGLTVALIGAQGVRHVASHPEQLGPGELVLVPFGEFEPIVPDETQEAQIEIGLSNQGDRPISKVSTSQ